MYDGGSDWSESGLRSLNCVGEGRNTNFRL